ncbi:MAG: tRNA (adenosine(37)-N6)-threonylcarbamoyltransferase complex ATPase subunit type 1 TsaE [Thermodesulfobacteriota bacterium]
MYRVLEVTSRSEEETFELGCALGAFLQPGDTVLLYGDLGSGKTVLAKGIISRAAGVSSDEVVSPTFTLINSFEGPFPVHHADLYRLEPDMIDDIGLDETIDQGGALVVEWAEKLGWLGTDPLRVRLDRSSDAESREIRLEWDDEGPWKDRPGDVICRKNSLDQAP